MLSRISIQILCSTSAGQGWADTSAPVEQMVGWRGGLGISGMGWIICGQSWHPSGKSRAGGRAGGCAWLAGRAIGTEAIAGASWSSSSSSSSSPSSLSQVRESAGRLQGRLWARLSLHFQSSNNSRESQIQILQENQHSTVKRTVFVRLLFVMGVRDLHKC